MNFKNKEQIIEDLYSRKYKLVLGFCMRFTFGDIHEAENLTQDIFLNAYSNLDKFRGDSKVDTWFYRITKNHCLNYVRYKNQHKRHANKIYSVEKIIEDHNTLDYEHGGKYYNLYKYLEDKKQPNILNSIIQKNYLEQIIELIQTLSPLHKECILSFLDTDDFNSYEEVSEKLGVPVNTVRSRLSRARSIFKRKVKIRL